MWPTRLLLPFASLELLGRAPSGEKCVIVIVAIDKEILVVGQWYPPCACVLQSFQVVVKVKVKAKTQFYWPSGHRENRLRLSTLHVASSEEFRKRVESFPSFLE